MVDQQLLIGARADGLGDGLALSAPDHRTDAQALLIGIHVGNGEIGLEGAHLAALVFARQELEAVLAGRKREARVVLDVPAGELRGALAHFHFDGVAHVALDLSPGVGHLADEIEFGGVAGAAARQGDFAARDLHRDRHEVMVAHQAEVVDLQRQRQIRHRVAQDQRLLQLPLLVGGGRFVELLGGEIAVAVIELRLVLLGNVDLHAAELAIGRRIVVVVAEHVVAAEVFVRLLDAEGQVVGIEQRLAAGIFGEREERLLLVVELRSSAR